MPPILQAVVRAVSADEMAWERMSKEQRRNGHHDRHMKDLVRRLGEKAARGVSCSANSGSDAYENTESNGDEDEETSAATMKETSGASHNAIDILQEPIHPGEDLAETEAEAIEDSETSESSQSILCDGTGACRDLKHSLNPPLRASSKQPLPRITGRPSPPAQASTKTPPEREEEFSEGSSTIVVVEELRPQSSSRPGRSRRSSSRAQEGLSLARDKLQAKKFKEKGRLASKVANITRPATKLGKRLVSANARADETRSGRTRRLSKRAQESAESARSVWLAARLGKEKRLPAPAKPRARNTA